MLEQRMIQVTANRELRLSKPSGCSCLIWILLTASLFKICRIIIMCLAVAGVSWFLIVSYKYIYVDFFSFFERERERKLQRWSVISLRAWSALERSGYPLTLLSCQLQLAAFLSVTMVLTLCPPTPTHHMLDGGCYHWLCSRGSADLPADNSELNLLDNIQGLVRQFAAEVGSECYTTTMMETHKRRIQLLSTLVLISWFACWESLVRRKGEFITTVAHSRYLVVRLPLEGTHKVSWGFFFPSGQIFTTHPPPNLLRFAPRCCTSSPHRITAERCVCADFQQWPRWRWSSVKAEMMQWNSG